MRGQVASDTSSSWMPLRSLAVALVVLWLVIRAYQMCYTSPFQPGSHRPRWVEPLSSLYEIDPKAVLLVPRQRLVAIQPIEGRLVQHTCLSPPPDQFVEVFVVDRS